MEDISLVVKTLSDIFRTFELPGKAAIQSSTTATIYHSDVVI